MGVSGRGTPGGDHSLSAIVPSNPVLTPDSSSRSSRTARQRTDPTLRHCWGRLSLRSQPCPMGPPGDPPSKKSHLEILLVSSWHLPQVCCQTLPGLCVLNQVAGPSCFLLDVCLKWGRSEAEPKPVHGRGNGLGSPGRPETAAGMAHRRGKGVEII